MPKDQKLPISLPEPTLWQTPEDVGRYALACLHAAGLQDWGFAWDRAARRLGCCKPAKRCISLSIYFVKKNLRDNQALIRRTILHELAHALAWTLYRATGHGTVWKGLCARLGIPDEKARCTCADFAPASIRERPDRYALCHKETGEVFRRYKTKPRITAKRLASTYITGQKAETLGKLCIISL